MTKAEKILAAKLLELYSDELAKHICNDLTEDLKSTLTQEEWRKFDREYHQWNGDPEEHTASSHDRLGDFSLASFLAHKLLKD